MKLKILKYTAVATWRWKQGAEDDVCGICQSEFEATCPNDDCKYPGESCPVGESRVPVSQAWAMLQASVR